MKHISILYHFFCTVLFSTVFIVLCVAQERLAVIPFDTPDPTAIESPDGKGVYVFTTGRRIQILYSENFFDWKRTGTVFSKNRFLHGFPDWVHEAIPGATAIWAPDIVFFNDRYYVYYSVSTFGKQRSVIGLASNGTLDVRSPDYEWRDEGIVLESHPDRTNYNAIDSAFFRDEDGKAYLFWGSYWTGIKAVEVDSKTGKPFNYVEGDLKIPADYVAVASRRRDTSIEAPYLVRRGDYYYLFTSRGSCCDGVKSTYHLVVGRSTKPLGPYVDKDGRPMDRGGGTVILSSTEKWKGTGHNGFFRTTGTRPNNEWLILAAYDSESPEKGRLTQIRPLTWDESDWPVPGDVLAE